MVPVRCPRIPAALWYTPKAPKTGTFISLDLPIDADDQERANFVIDISNSQEGHAPVPRESLPILSTADLRAANLLEQCQTLLQNYFELLILSHDVEHVIRILKRCPDLLLIYTARAKCEPNQNQALSQVDYRIQSNFKIIDRDLLITTLSYSKNISDPRPNAFVLLDCNIDNFPWKSTFLFCDYGAANIIFEPLDEDNLAKFDTYLHTCRSSKIQFMQYNNISRSGSHERGNAASSCCSSADLDEVDELIKKRTLKRIALRSLPVANRYFDSLTVDHVLHDLFLCQNYRQIPHLTFAEDLKTPESLLRGLRTIQNINFDISQYTETDLAFLSRAILFFFHGLIPESLHINDVYSFIQTVVLLYNESNSYHSFTHAFDVMQAILVIMTDLGLIPKLDDTTSMELLSQHPDHSKIGSHYEGKFKSKEFPNLCYPDAEPILNKTFAYILVLAALLHDIGHPGLNNPTLSLIKAPLSKLSYGKAVLEYHHTQLARNILAAAAPNLEMSHGSSIANAIISTEMTEHESYMDLFESFIPSCDAQNMSKMESSMYCKGVILAIILKSADVSNVLRPTQLSKSWQEKLEEEVSAQEQLLKTLHYKSTISVELKRPSFANEIVKPLVKQLARFFPEVSYLSNLVGNEILEFLL